MQNYTFSVRDTLRYSVYLFKQQPRTLIIACAPSALVQLVLFFFGISLDDRSPVRHLADGLLDTLIYPYLSIAAYIACVAAYDGRAMDMPWKKVFFGHNKYFLRLLLYSVALKSASYTLHWEPLSSSWPYAIASILYLYLLLRFSFMPIIAVDKDLGLLECFSLSWKITKGHLWPLILFTVPYILLFLVSSFTVVGAFVVSPILWIAFISVFRQLFGLYAADERDSVVV